MENKKIFINFFAEFFFNIKEYSSIPNLDILSTYELFFKLRDEIKTCVIPFPCEFKNSSSVIYEIYKNNYFPFFTNSNILIPGMMHSLEYSSLLCKNYYTPFYIRCMDSNYFLNPEVSNSSYFSLKKPPLYKSKVFLIYENNFILIYEFNSIIYCIEKNEKKLKILFLSIYDMDSNILKIYHEKEVISSLESTVRKKLKNYYEYLSKRLYNIKKYNVEVIEIIADKIAEFSENNPEDNITENLIGKLTTDEEISSYIKRKAKQAYAKC